VDLLVSELNLITEVRRLNAEALAGVVRTLARTLRGVTFDLVEDTDWVQRAAEAELSKLADRDRSDRGSASERALKQLDEREFLFGASTAAVGRRTA